VVWPILDRNIVGLRRKMLGCGTVNLYIYICRRIERGRGSAYSEKDGVEEVEGTSGERGNGFTARFLF